MLFLLFWIDASVSYACCIYIDCARSCIYVFLVALDVADLAGYIQ